MIVFTRLFCFCATVLFWLSSFESAQSQSYDVVYYSGGEAVHCDLIEVTDYTVRYRLHDLPDGEIYNELRDDIVLIFKRNGDFLLPVESGVTWKEGANPNYSNIITEDSQVLAAHDIEEHEDIMYYHDALDSTDASIRTDEIVAIVYQDGAHRLFADIDQVAFALGGALAFAVSVDSDADAVASTESMSAPLSEDSLANSSDSNAEDVMSSGEEMASEDTYADPEGGEIPQEEDVAMADIATEETVPEDEIAEPEEPSIPSEAMTEEQPPQEELELSDTDYEEFAAKAVNKAEYLNNYLSLLCNRTLDIYDKEQAKESALRLFVHDSTVVQVSSLHREEIETYTIDGYLEHLTLFDYDKVELLWRNVQYVTKFRLAPDGNYYGTITVEQVFRGMKDGRPIYEDITQKDIEIVLGNFRKEESGVTEYAWDVFLSDIGVEETRRL